MAEPQRFSYPDLVNFPAHAGRVSVTQFASSATFTNVALSGRDWAGAALVYQPANAAPILVGFIAEGATQGVYENLTLPLAAAYNGATITNGNFYIMFGQASADAASVASMLGYVRSLFQQNFGLFAHYSDILDVSQVRNNSLLWDATTKTFLNYRNGVFTTLDVSRLGTPMGRWDGNASKFALGTTGSVAVNFNNGIVGLEGASRYFGLNHTASFTLQLPTNVVVGSVFYITFLAVGAGHVPAFVAGYTGVAASAISVEDGGRTRLRFEVTAQTGGTATAVTVSAVTFDENQIVEDGGYLFMSNVDDNVDYPRFVSTLPVSTISWTYVPLQKGDPGSAVVTGTSASSLAIGTGSKAFVIAETNPARGWGVGTRLRATSAANPTTHYMIGIVTAYDGTTMTMTVDVIAGSGTRADWRISIDGERGLPGSDPGQRYIWSTTVTDADPGTNIIRANNASLASATQLFIDDLSAGGDDLSAYWNTLDDSTNTIKGEIQIKSLVDNDVAIFNVTGVTDATGYTKITVSGHSGVASFANAELVSLQFFRAGDKGADGLGTGDVVGPASSVDNIIPRFHSTTGKVIQSSGISIDDSDIVQFPNTTGAKLNLYSTDYGIGIESQTVTTYSNTNFRWRTGGGGMAGTERMLLNTTGLTLFGVTISGPASTTLAGPIEIATAAEFRASTDTTRCLGVAETWASVAEVTLTDAATIAVNFASFINGVVTLAGNRALGNPTNEVQGQSGRIRIVQDATGSRTLSFGTDWEFAGGIAPVLSTAANAQDMLYYDIVAADRIVATLVKDVK
jgi:hypothetical protein